MPPNRSLKFVRIFRTPVRIILTCTTNRLALGEQLHLARSEAVEEARPKGLTSSKKQRPRARGIEQRLALGTVLEGDARPFPTTQPSGPPLGVALADIGEALDAVGNCYKT